MHSTSTHESKSESEVAQSCPALFNPMDYSPPGFSIHGIFWPRIMEWVAISFSRVHSWVTLRDDNFPVFLVSELRVLPRH